MTELKYHFDSTKTFVNDNLKCLTTNIHIYFKCICIKLFIF